MNSSHYDVIIIGGGPAGMNAALVLGRSRIQTLIINAGSPRNAVTTHSHGFLTQDGKHPSEIFALAKAQLEKYPSVSYVKGHVHNLKSLDSGFELAMSQGSFYADRVVLATGYRDNIGEVGIKGLEAVYGKSVYPCPFCDGFELADKKLGVFGPAAIAPHFARVIQHWSSDVMVFTDGDKVEDSELKASLSLNGVGVIETEIRELISVDGQLKKVVFENGESIEREGGFLADTKATESVDFARKLNIPREEGHFGHSAYHVDDMMETNVKGFFIIGDSRVGFGGLVNSAADGYQVATAITHQIIEDRWKQ